MVPQNHCGLRLIWRLSETCSARQATAVAAVGGKRHTANVAQPLRLIGAFCNIAKLLKNIPLNEKKKQEVFYFRSV